MGRPPASGSSGYPPTPAPAEGSEDSAPSTTREGVGPARAAQSAEPFAGAPQAAGSSSRPRERRCYWRKVPGLRRDWPQPGPPPPAAPRRPRGCAARAWGRRALRGAGARGSLRPRAMLPPALLCALCGGLWAAAARAGYSEDRCRWRGSGLTQEPGSVGQLALACAEGEIQWLYPAGALRLTLGGSDPGARPGIACLRPAQPFAGAQVFAERAGGGLELLLAEGPGPAGGRCVRWGSRERRALFLQATPHPDISRRVASFRFELREDLRPELPLQARGLGADGACRPCSDAELLLAACTSDFVIHGTIHGVAHDMELQESVITVAADRVLRQSLPLFRVGGSGGQVQASIHTPLQCGIRPGPGTFLFMGWSHFGEAWLGCAPRFQEFSRAYMAAHADRLHPCEVALD
ncbi:meteorin [Manis pentadactyla]|uniref:meteorin n=1 Tax=Manis pentadactyla TaxID=143292 RepID=UPI00255CBCF3|nr:meteorin [Manis pentadactyla]